MFKIILKTDIENWRATFESVGDYPFVISQLIRATAPAGTYIDFPSGKAVYTGGYDGITECPGDGSTYTPAGKSVWELATYPSNTVEGKADKDYEKRKLNPRITDPSEWTYIFVCACVWEGRREWQEQKSNENFWKAVRVYDSIMMEQWFAETPIISKWFANLILKTHGLNNMRLVTEFWDEWAQGPAGLILDHKALTVGRAREQEALYNFFEGEPRIFAVKASSKYEAVAFIIATAMQFEPTVKDRFLAKSLVVEDVNSFRQFSEGYRNPLNIIATTDDRAPVHKAVSRKHHVLLPLGPDDDYNSSDIITLPRLEKEGLVKALIESGVTPNEAEGYVHESASNMTVLRRLLRFSVDKLEWTKPDNAKEIIPAMLLGRWTYNQGDKEILKALSGVEYEIYISKIEKWKESVFLQIGQAWRLISPLDAWTIMSPVISTFYIEKLRTTFLQVLTYEDPYDELNSNERLFAKVQNQQPKYSPWAKEGLVQSLILIGLYGESLKLANMPSPQLWVDSVIAELLSDAKGRLWATLNYQMPRIAEASPTSFLDAVEKSLSMQDPPILQMFVEEDDFIAPKSSHTGLLWALESLAWLPDHFGRACAILAKLAKADPGGRLSNRPQNSLYEIFKPWAHQTYANFDERMTVLRLIAEKQPEVAWKLLPKLLPHDAVGHSNHKLRWRMFAFESPVSTKAEYYRTHPIVIDILLSTFNFTEEEMSELLSITTNLALAFNDRDRVFDFITDNYDKTKHDTEQVLDGLRRILSHHREFPESEWSLTEGELMKYEALYLDKQPVDPIKKNIWMFNDSWPRFPDVPALRKMSTDDQYLTLQKKRDTGLSEIYKQFGIETVIDLSTKVKFPWPFGDSLSRILVDETDILNVLEGLKKETDNPNFIAAFIQGKALASNFSWVNQWYQKLRENSFSDADLTKFFVPVPQSKELWNLILTVSENVDRIYWETMSPSFHHLSIDQKIIGFKNLLNAGRNISALREAWFYANELPIELIVEILQKAPLTDVNKDKVKIENHQVTKLFEEIDKRGKVDEQTIGNLEFNYLEILTEYGSIKKPLLLHNELNIKPKFFIELLKLTYRPKSDETAAKEREGLTNEQIMLYGRRAYELLNSWKSIPGVDKEGNVDAEVLNNWVNEVRNLAIELDRIEVADMKIGEILAKYDAFNKGWPDEILQVIESIDTQSIKNNFSAGIFNLRGSSTRGVFEGGNIEREHAKHFRELAVLHRAKFPHIASVFEKLSNGYSADAKLMDDEAERMGLDY